MVLEGPVEDGTATLLWASGEHCTLWWEHVEEQTAYIISQKIEREGTGLWRDFFQ